MKKRGIFFTTDAIIALMIIFLTIMIAFPVIQYSSYETNIPADILNVLGSIKTGEIDNNYVSQLIANGTITDLNKSILVQIGEFYVTNITIAKTLAENVLLSLNIEDNIGLWYETTLLASINDSSLENAKNIETERRVISGLKQGESISGFSSRTFLSRSLQTDYIYFGGYTGEGNISSRIEYDGDLRSVDIELVTNEDFDIYVNDIYSGHYENSSDEFTPKSYNLTSYLGNFNSGVNIIKFVEDGVGENFRILGGFIKIGYENSTLFQEKPVRYYFPGIEGPINLYDSFYIPNKLNEMTVYLHFRANFFTFLRIGNTTVLRNITNGEQIFTLSNSELSSMLDYDDLVNKTIPLRFGIENATYVSNETIDSDVFSVVDLSGSMNQCALNCTGVPIKMIDLARDANIELISVILNFSSNSVGLVGYATSAEEGNYNNLTMDSESLNNTIGNWSTGGGELCLLWSK